MTAKSTSDAELVAAVRDLRLRAEAAERGLAIAWTERDEERARAERAEATIARVEALARDWDPLGYIRAALRGEALVVSEVE